VVAAEAAERTPLASQYSSFLFRQPRFSFLSLIRPEGVVQRAPQKQEIQTHAWGSVNGPISGSALTHAAEFLGEKWREA
jgi:hypothetical protein